MPWLAQLLIGLALNILAYLLMPKPKPHEQKAKDMETPTVDPGRPIPIMFGTNVMKDTTIIWVGDKKKVRRKAKTKDSGKK